MQYFQSSWYHKLLYKDPDWDVIAEKLLNVQQVNKKLDPSQDNCIFQDVNDSNFLNLSKHIMYPEKVWYVLNAFFKTKNLWKRLTDQGDLLLSSTY